MRLLNVRLKVSSEPSIVIYRAGNRRSLTTKPASVRPLPLLFGRVGNEHARVVGDVIEHPRIRTNAHEGTNRNIVVRDHQPPATESSPTAIV